MNLLVLISKLIGPRELISSLITVPLLAVNLVGLVPFAIELPDKEGYELTAKLKHQDSTKNASYVVGSGFAAKTHKGAALLVPW